MLTLEFLLGKEVRGQISTTSFIIKPTPGLVNPNTRKVSESLSCSSVVSRFLYKVSCSVSWECSKWLTYRTFSVNACFFHTSYLLYTRPQEMLSNIICQVYKTTLSNYLGFPHSVVGQEDLKLLETSVCSRDPRLSCWCHVTLRNEERFLYCIAYNKSKLDSKFSTSLPVSWFWL